LRNHRADGGASSDAPHRSKWSERELLTWTTKVIDFAGSVHVVQVVQVKNEMVEKNLLSLPPEAGGAPSVS
jgi:hypothetical protein